MTCSLAKWRVRLHVERTRHVDCSAPDASGALEDAYEYEYDIYRFVDGERCLIARSYIDTPSEAHFLSIEIAGKSRLLRMPTCRIRCGCSPGRSCVERASCSCAG